MLRAVLAAIFVTSTSSLMFKILTRVGKFHTAATSWTSIKCQNQHHDTKSGISLPLSGEFTSISFFRFVRIPDPPYIVGKIKLQFGATPGVRGTVLLAKEGVNAQLVVPKQLVELLPELLSGIDSNIFRSININVGQTIDYERSDIPFPFKRLIVREKQQILTDGISSVDDGICPEAVALDWDDAGPEVSPSQWHNELSQLTTTETPSTIVLDCRNTYESEMGTFLYATPLNTTKFSETWLAIENKLAGVPKDTRILTFCTGGIRCVKVNAYLKQRMGYENIGRLQDGIIRYEGYIAEQQNNQMESSAVTTSTFVGENFLFDRRRLRQDDGPWSESSESDGDMSDSDPHL